MQISQEDMTVNKVVSFLAIADNDSPAFENLKNDVNTLESKKQKMEKNLHNLEDEIASSKGLL
jgi:prefoldin subunit 5